MANRLFLPKLRYTLRFVLIKKEKKNNVRLGVYVHVLLIYYISQNCAVSIDEFFNLYLTFSSVFFSLSLKKEKLKSLSLCLCQFNNQVVNFDMEFLFTVHKSKGFMKFYGLGLNIKETLSLCIMFFFFYRGYITVIHK